MSHLIKSNLDFYTSSDKILHVVIKAKSQFHHMKCFIQTKDRILSPDESLKELSKPEAKTDELSNHTSSLERLSDDRLEQLAKECIKQMKETHGFEEFLKSIGNAIPHFEALDSDPQNQRTRIALEKALHNFRNETLAEHDLERHEFSEIDSEVYMKINTSETEKKCTLMIYYPTEWFRRFNLDMVRFNGEIHLQHPLGSIKIIGDDPNDIEIFSSPKYLKDFLLSWIFSQTTIFENELETIDLDDDNISDEKDNTCTTDGIIRTSFSPSQIAILILSVITLTAIPALTLAYGVSQLYSLLLLTGASLMLTLMWRNSSYNVSIQQQKPCPVLSSQVHSNDKIDNRTTYEMVRQDIMDTMQMSDTKEGLHR